MAADRAGVRWRASAVVAALVVGAGATLATTPGPERCPDPPADGEVSAFYGPQEHEGGKGWTAGSWSFDVDGRTVPAHVSVYAPGCIAAAARAVTVAGALSFEGERIGAAPERALRTLTVSDGRGRVWEPVQVDSQEWKAQEYEGGRAVPARADLTFALPVDIAPPVTLHLGDLSGDVSTVPLDEPASAPGAP